MKCPREYKFFFLASVLSVLTHESNAIFIFPIIFFCFIKNIKFLNKEVLGHFLVMIGLYLIWPLYKKIILPSSDALTKYGLFGDYGLLNKSFSKLQLGQKLYSSITFEEWFFVKKTMLIQLFYPLVHRFAGCNLNYESGSNYLDKLRAWDFMMLSKGNILLVFFMIITIFKLVEFYFFDRKRYLKHKLIVYGLLICLVAYLISIFSLMIPIIIHHLPSILLFLGLILSAFFVYEIFPCFFYISMAIQLIYTSIVWLIQPLHQQLILDIRLILMTFLISALFFLNKRKPY
jgi:hypothetical protein